MRVYVVVNHATHNSHLCGFVQSINLEPRAAHGRITLDRLALCPSAHTNPLAMPMNTHRSVPAPIERTQRRPKPTKRIGWITRIGGLCSIILKEKKTRTVPLRARGAAVPGRVSRVRQRPTAVSGALPALGINKKPNEDRDCNLERDRYQKRYPNQIWEQHDRSKQKMEEHIPYPRVHEPASLGVNIYV
ncbi:hypothetical protein EVAR_70000_1 [Eumeta japonica]|uniref:Uncharacterized protein n=1 Tax=Eumeta variegata TaxID=151549 RepID=A0A4C2A347_EUMVA|nr:hypothetical protein EVAR_70000_1 [Eumeta japonica]